MIAFRREVSPHYHDVIVELCVSAGFNPTIVHQVSVWQSAVELVRSGLGVAIIPWIHSKIASSEPGIGPVFVRLSGTSAASRTFACCPEHGNSGRLAQEFAKSLARRLATSERP